MNFIHITLVDSKGNPLYDYNSYYVPRAGEKINFTFTQPHPVSGVVSAAEWKHAADVVLTVK